MAWLALPILGAPAREPWFWRRAIESGARPSPLPPLLIETTRYDRVQPENLNEINPSISLPTWGSPVRGRASLG